MKTRGTRFMAFLLSLALASHATAFRFPSDTRPSLSNRPLCEALTLPLGWVGGPSAVRRWSIRAAGFVAFAGAAQAHTFTRVGHSVQVTIASGDTPWQVAKEMVRAEGGTSGQILNTAVDMSVEHHGAFVPGGQFMLDVTADVASQLTGISRDYFVKMPDLPFVGRPDGLADTIQSVSAIAPEYWLYGGIVIALVAWVWATRGEPLKRAALSFVTRMQVSPGVRATLLSAALFGALLPVRDGLQAGGWLDTPWTPIAASVLSATGVLAGLYVLAQHRLPQDAAAIRYQQAEKYWHHLKLQRVLGNAFQAIARAAQHLWELLTLQPPLPELPASVPAPFNVQKRSVRVSAILDRFNAPAPPAPAVWFQTLLSHGWPALQAQAHPLPHFGAQWVLYGLPIPFWGLPDSGTLTGMTWIVTTLGWVFTKADAWHLALEDYISRRYGALHQLDGVLQNAHERTYDSPQAVERVARDFEGLWSSLRLKAGSPNTPQWDRYAQEFNTVLHFRGAPDSKQTVFSNAVQTEWRWIPRTREYSVRYTPRPLLWLETTLRVMSAYSPLHIIENPMQMPKLLRWATVPLFFWFVLGDRHAQAQPASAPPFVRFSA